MIDQNNSHAVIGDETSALASVTKGFTGSKPTLAQPETDFVFGLEPEGHDGRLRALDTDSPKGKMGLHMLQEVSQMQIENGSATDGQDELVGPANLSSPA